MFASQHPWKKAFEGGSGMVFYRNPEFGRGGDFSVEIIEAVREGGAMAYQISYGMIELTPQGVGKYGPEIIRLEPAGILQLWAAMGIDDVEKMEHVQIGESRQAQPGCLIYAANDSLIDIIRDVIPGFDHDALRRSDVTLIRREDSTSPSPDF